jgi:CubicO group peptidase (beta-lactamase class C family)
MRRLFPLAGAALALALPATAADVQLPTDPMSAEDTAAIDAAIEAALEANPEIPAMYIGVWDPERGYCTQAYGQWQPEQLIGDGVDAGVKEPGTPGYSTTNYIVLQELAETLTGEAIQELMAKRLTEPLGLTGTALPYNEDTTLTQPQSYGYMSTACIEELIKDGAVPVPVGTDTTDWNASYGQSGGGMHSTIEDLGTWAASMSGSSLLSGELAEKRLDWHDIGAGVFQYGLGISQFSNEVGHEGEAIGWEGWAGHDPETSLTAVVFTNSCADLGEVLKGVDAVDPVFAPYGEMVLSFLEG